MNDIAEAGTDANRAMNTLAEEIRVNPDKGWRDSLMERYTRFLASRGFTDGTVRPIEEWREGTAEVTEATLRINGYTT